jgi:hypothetical protein
MLIVRLGSSSIRDTHNIDIASDFPDRDPANTRLLVFSVAMLCEVCPETNNIVSFFILDRTLKLEQEIFYGVVVALM